MKKQTEQYIQKIADYYGLDNQTDKTIEECAELIQALVKLESRENTIEEIDVSVKENINSKMFLTHSIQKI